MAASIVSNDDQRLESFLLIWLDPNVNVSCTEDTEQKLRSIINNLKKFQDVKQCQKYIGQRSQKDRTVLIVNGRLGREIVPYIHQLRQIISIYVFCTDQKSNIEWSSKFSKVKGVIVEFKELIFRITEDHKIQKKIEEPLSINIFAGGESTTGLNGDFVFAQILIDYLVQLKSTQSDQNELINLCKIEYAGNSNELKNLQKFRKEYSPNKVLWWYTNESFFYKILNSALRTKNIHVIFLLRSYISDIYHQLHEYRSKKSLRVYRCQMISNDELQTLKASIGQFISINSFFSTSANYQQALSFLDGCDTSENSQKLLFQIDADPRMVTSKPFADISKLSVFPDESEILFMIGSIFRVAKIYNRHQMWIIEMTLCNDTEHDLKPIISHMKQQIGTEKPNLRTFAKLVWKMGKLDLAEKYFTRLLKELPSNHPLISTLFGDLSELASQRGNFNMSVEWLQKRLEHNRECQLTNNSNNKNSKYYCDFNNDTTTSSKEYEFDNESTISVEDCDFDNVSLKPCPDNVNCLFQYETDYSGAQHNSMFSHPCRFSELCRNKESHRTHRTHHPRPSPMCRYDEKCNRLIDPFHRAAYRHTNLSDFLIPCRYQSDCYDTSYKHRKKYSHGEQVLEGNGT